MRDLLKCAIQLLRRTWNHLFFVFKFFSQCQIVIIFGCVIYSIQCIGFKKRNKDFTR